VISHLKFNILKVKSDHVLTNYYTWVS